MYAETRDIPGPAMEETRYMDPGGAEPDEPFLRARQRVSVRRRGGSRLASRFGAKSRWMRVVAILIAVAVLCLIAGAAWETKSLLLHDPHFRLNSAQNIQVTGDHVVTATQVLALFAPDLGHSIVRVPLAKRRTQIEQIRWVRRATVMRLWPNRLRVSVLERRPIAFARDGNSIRLVDDEGVLLDLPNAAAQHYSFPVLSGLTSSEPLSTRAAQIEQYRQFVQSLDAGGGHISAALSEVDLSDPEDVRAIFTGGAHQPLVHFGVSDFLPRYRAYRAHLAEWLQQYPQLRSVDMRYGKQVVLDTGTVAEPVATSDAIKEPAAVNRAARSQPVPIHKSSVTKKKVANTARKKHGATRHPTKVHKKKHKPAPPQRGHPVRHPIMHVVTGI